MARRKSFTKLLWASSGFALAVASLYFEENFQVFAQEKYENVSLWVSSVLTYVKSNAQVINLAILVLLLGLIVSGAWYAIKVNSRNKSKLRRDADELRGKCNELMREKAALSGRLYDQSEKLNDSEARNGRLVELHKQYAWASHYLNHEARDLFISLVEGALRTISSIERLSLRTEDLTVISKIETHQEKLDATTRMLQASLRNDRNQIKAETKNYTRKILDNLCSMVEASFETRGIADKVYIALALIDDKSLEASPNIKSNVTEITPPALALNNATASLFEMDQDYRKLVQEVSNRRGPGESFSISNIASCNDFQHVMTEQSCFIHNSLKDYKATVDSYASIPALYEDELALQSKLVFPVCKRRRSDQSISYIIGFLLLLSPNQSCRELFSSELGDPVYNTAASTADVLAALFNLRSNIGTAVDHLIVQRSLGLLQLRRETDIKAV